MKRRIIAALTALVMVVTMIPSTAFGYDWQPEQVKGLIYQATAQGTGTLYNVPYTAAEQKAIKDAKEAYASLSLTEKAEVNADTEALKHYDALLVAEAIYNHYGEAIAEYNAALKGFKKGIINVENGKLIKNGDKVVTPELARIQDATAVVAANAEIDVYLADGKTLVVPKGTTKLPAEFVGKKPTTTYNKTTTLSSCLNKEHLDNDALAAKELVETYFTEDITEPTDVAVKAIAAINAVTTETVANLEKDPKPGTKAEAAQEIVDAAIAAVKTAGDDWLEFVEYAKNYSVYKAALDKLASFEVPKEVQKEIDNAEALITGESYDSAFTLEDTTSTATEPSIFEGNLKEAKVAISNAEATYNKYKATYKEAVETLAINIKAAKENLALYEEAVAIKKEIEAYGTPEKLTEEQAIAILNIDKTNKFKKNDRLDNIDRFFIGAKATGDKRVVKAAYVKLEAKANEVLGLKTKEAIIKEYAAKFKAINDTLLITKVSIKDAAKFEETINVLNDYAKVAATNSDLRADALKFVVEESDNRNKLGLIDDAATKYASITSVKGSLVDDNNDNAIKGADFDSFKTKLDIVVSADTDVKAEIEKINDLFAADYLADIADTKKIIKDFRDAVAKFTYAEKAAYDFIETPRLSDEDKENAVEEQISIIEAAVAKKELREAAEKDLVAIEKAKAVAKIINDKIVIKSDNGTLTEANKAQNAVAFDEIKELFKTENVELVFRGLTDHSAVEVDVDYPRFLSPETLAARNLKADGFQGKTYKYYDEIVRYQTALEEAGIPVEVPAAAKAVIEAIDGLKVGTDLAANANAFNVVYAAYNNLTADEKAYVTNYTKLENFANNASILVAKAMEEKSLSLITVSGSLTSDQIAICKEIKALLDANKDMLTLVGAYDAEKTAMDEMFKTPYFTGDIENYYLALKELNKAEKEQIIIKEIAPVYETFAKGVKTESEITKVELPAVVKTIDTFKALSKEAQNILLVSDTETRNFSTVAADAHALLKKTLNVKDLADFNIGVLREALSKEVKYKSLILDFATIEAIEDQEFADAPVVVPNDKIIVKDASGAVVPADKYDVAFSDNEKPGVATVTITAKESANIIGMVSTTFVIKEKADVAPGKMEQPTVDTDFGLIKVTYKALDRDDVTYRVAYKLDGGKYVYQNLGTTNDVVLKVAKNGRYNVRVAAIYNGKNCGYSDSMYVYANPANVKGQQMNAIKVKATSANRTVKIATTKAGYENVTYRYRIKYDGGNWSRPSDSKSTVKYVKNLKAGRTCTVAVAYYYKSDLGRYVSSNYTYAKVRVK